MDCIVRTNLKVRAGTFQSLRRPKHDLAQRLPVFPVIERKHVLSQCDGVHGHFRVGVAAHERLGFQTKSAIAERRSLRAAADDTDMSAHARKSICCRKRSFFSTGRNEASKEFRASSRRCSSEKLNSCCAISYSRLSEV